MEQARGADERLTNLEIKVTYTEDMVEELNKTVFRQQEQLDMLIEEVRQLRQQQPDGAGIAPRNARDDLPPHF